MFCEIFNMDKEQMEKYKLKFEFIGKEIKILEINKKYIFFEGNLELNENDAIMIYSWSLNADKCI